MHFFFNGMHHKFACQPCAGATLIFSVLSHFIYLFLVHMLKPAPPCTSERVREERQMTPPYYYENSIDLAEPHKRCNVWELEDSRSVKIYKSLQYRLFL